MSTWWQSVTRADIGLADIKFGSADFSVTNRGWYVLYKILHQMEGRSYEHAAKKGQQYVPQSVVEDWANRLAALGSDDWLQVSCWNGSALRFHSVVHRQEARRYANDHELTPLLLTPVGMWLQGIANNLVSAGSGIVISGKPRKGSTMSQVLTKGQRVDLTKGNPGLSKLVVGAGWDVRATSGDDYDVDLSAFVLKTGDKVVSSEHFVYFNRLESPEGAVKHTGDNLTGAGDGDDEQILVDLSKLPANAEKVVFAVCIFEAKKRGNQTFGQIDNCFIRIVDETTGKELLRYDLTEDSGPKVNAMVFGELYRNNGEWKFKAVGDGYEDEIPGLIARFGA